MGMLAPPPRLAAAATAAAWAWCLSAWCMCGYVAPASREGLRWFSPRRNPYLMLSAAAGPAAVAALGPSDATLPPVAAFAAAASLWTFYAALVTRQHGRWGQWCTHVLPAVCPLVALFAGGAARYLLFK